MSNGSTARLSIAVAAGARDNLLTNPGFDTDLLGWTETGAPGAIITAWDAADVDGGTGAASVTSVHPSGNNGVGLQQCLPVIEGVTYSWGERASSRQTRDRPEM